MSTPSNCMLLANPCTCGGASRFEENQLFVLSAPSIQVLYMIVAYRSTVRALCRSASRP